MTDITLRLSRMQKALKAPKEENRNVSYKSRSAEQILEAAKALLEDGEYITCTDDLVFLEGRFYIKSTATLGCGGEEKSAPGFAREPDDAPLSSSGKPMMQLPQLTGSSSSYARKYALTGLFALDDSADDPDKKDNEKDYGKKMFKTAEDAKFAQTIIFNELEFCLSQDAVQTVWGKHKEGLEALKAEYPHIFETIDQHKYSLEQQELAEKEPNPQFSNVAHAEQWGMDTKAAIEKAENLARLQALEHQVNAYKKALDAKLNAAKYNKDGSPSERLFRAIKGKLQEFHANTP